MNFRMHWSLITAAIPPSVRKAISPSTRSNTLIRSIPLLMPLIFLALGGIGLPGGAVYIETWRIRDRRWLSAVSLAGPSANFIVAFILGVLLSFTPLGQASIAPALSFLAYLQVTAVVLNLIPLPPLDGFGIIAPYLNPDLRETISRLGGSAMLIIFVLMWYVPLSAISSGPSRSLSLQYWASPFRRSPGIQSVLLLEVSHKLELRGL